MQNRMLIIGTVITVVVVVVYFDRRAVHAELAELRHDAASNAERQVMEPPLVRVVSSPAPVRAAAEPLAAKPEPLATPARAEAREAAPHKPETPIEQFALVHDTLETAFASQAHDGVWAMEARRRMDATLLARLPVKSAVTSIDCRSTLCRIETTHDGYAYAREFVGQLLTPERQPWNGAFYTGPIAQDSRSGAVTFVTYLAREGVELPAIPDSSGDEPAAH